MRPVRAVALLVLVLLFAASPSGQGTPARAAARHVVLISIDGLRPDYYLPTAARRPRTPALDALVQRGSWAEGVLSQFPSLTYPSHTSIVTGVRPARHGIVQNTIFAPDGGGTWYFESSALRSAPIWDAARAAGLTTAGISWPVTVGARIDYLLPETNQAPRDSTWLDLMRRQSTPGLVDVLLCRADEAVQVRCFRVVGIYDRERPDSDVRELLCDVRAAAPETDARHVRSGQDVIALFTEEGLTQGSVTHRTPL